MAQVATEPIQKADVHHAGWSGAPRIRGAISVPVCATLSPNTVVFLFNDTP